MSITFVVPVSPIPSHPDTVILDETLASIRYHRPHDDLIITFDGVRDENRDMSTRYQEFIRSALDRAERLYAPVAPIIFDEHQHQSGMMKSIIDSIATPYLMYVEQDTPIVTDEPIDWAAIMEMFDSGEANTIRLHHEGVIPDDHTHMMHGVSGAFTRTSQWSQRPHVASTAYYRRIMDNHFTKGSKCFIEDRMHGVIDNAYRRDKLPGWNQHRLWIYTPPGGNIKRSYHTDGRAGAAKFDDTQVW